MVSFHAGLSCEGRSIRSSDGHAKRRNRTRRGGYALLICLFVGFVASAAMVAIATTARFETLELSAKQRSASMQWSAKAGIERTIALLVNNPNLRGPIPAVELPPGSGVLVSSTIQQNGQALVVTATANMPGATRTDQTNFTVTQLQQRIAAVSK